MANNVVAEARIYDSAMIWVEHNSTHLRPYLLDCGYNHIGLKVVEHLPQSYTSQAAAKAAAARILGFKPEWNC